MIVFAIAEFVRAWKRPDILRDDGACAKLNNLNIDMVRNIFGFACNHNLPNTVNAIAPTVR